MVTKHEETREQIVADMMSMERNRRIMLAQRATFHVRRVTLRGALLETTALNSGYNPPHKCFALVGHAPALKTGWGMRGFK